MMNKLATILIGFALLALMMAPIGGVHYISSGSGGALQGALVMLLVVIGMGYQVRQGIRFVRGRGAKTRRSR